MSRVAKLLLPMILLTAGCKHPLAIVGEGDIVDRNGTSYGCTLEQYQSEDIACTGFDFTEDYIVNYEGVPKPGWRFDHWEGPCKPDSSAPYCLLEAPLNFSEAMDTLFPGVLMPTTTAVFVQNSSPVADAGADQTVDEQTTVTIDGAGSTDSDGTIQNYTWVHVAGDPIEFLPSIATTSQTSQSFIAPTLVSVEVLSFELTVIDNDGSSSTDTMSVTVNPVNALPVADAGEDQFVDEQTTVTLAGTATDLDGTLTTVWNQTGGTAVTLSDSTNVAPNFTSPTLVAIETLTFELTATDNEGGVASDAVSVTVNPVNIPPVASAGSDQSVDEQTTVVLDGGGSVDADGSIVSYMWEQTLGTLVTLDDPSAISPTFMAQILTMVETLTFQLTVIDNEAGSISDSVSITVNPVNALPLVNAGPDQFVDEQTTVYLEESFSSDADGEIVSSVWSQVAGTAVVLSDTMSSVPSFDSPVVIEQEVLTFRLSVEDNEGASVIDTVDITVYPINLPPSVNAGFDKGANIGETVDVSATADDEDGHVTTFQWRVSDGDDLVLENETTASVSVSSVNSSSTTSVLELSVADNEGAISTDEVEVYFYAITGLQATKAINDTGVNWGSNYPSGDNEECIGETIEAQDCSFGADSSNDDLSDGYAGFRYTKIGISGEELDASAEEWYCVLDQTTVLIWETKRADGSIHDIANKYRWGGKTAHRGASEEFYDDWDVLIDGSNTEGLCGVDNWRVPTKIELVNLVCYGCLKELGSTFDPSYFPNQSRETYWSATSAIILFFGNRRSAYGLQEGVTGPMTRSVSFNVMLVSGEALSND